MDVKLTGNSSTQKFPGKNLDFCDNSSEHGYGSLEDLHNPVSPIIKSYGSTLPSSQQSSLSFSSSADSTANTNLESLESAQSPEKISGKECSSSQSNKVADDLNNNRINDDPIVENDSRNTSGKSKPNNKNNNLIIENTCSMKSTEGAKNGQNVKVFSPQEQFQSGNRFRFVPKNRQNNFNGDRHSFKQNNARCNNRGGRRATRSESDCDTKPRSTPIRNKNNEDIVFIIRKVDRSLRRTVSESSGETLPVRGILKYPRDWNRRTLSESSCDSSNQSNLLESHEKGQTQSLECISPLEASCEGSTESSCSSATEGPGQEEEKPKKSVHFSCYVSKATFKINSTILNNKQNGGNKKKNRKRDNNNKGNPTNSPVNPTNKNDISNTKHFQHNDRLKPQQPHHHSLQQQPNNHSQPNPTHQERISNQTRRNMNEESVIDSDDGPFINSADPPTDYDEEKQSENVDPMEAKMRSRQDSGYDSETSDRKGIDVNGTTCVKSPKRKFTIKKVDLNQ
ncbi:putative uncharacterized protein DDB_G0293878 isoform X2 [Tetranychus urticae]|nr:putative uncharacterized protein DDB_G0293878 isoform X2 [Tetranychus urticae]